MVLLLPGQSFPRFVLDVVPSAIAFPFAAPYNLWQSVPFYHNCSTSPGMYFHVFLFERDGIRLMGERVASDLVGTREEVRHLPS